MRIIRQGVKPEEKKYEFMCDKCLTVFECEKKEIKTYYYKNEIINQYNCPTCNSICFNYDN